MKHHLQEKGWQQMQAILDKEMPVKNKKRNYLIPLVLFISAGFIYYFVFSENERKGSTSKVKTPMANNIQPRDYVPKSEETNASGKIVTESNKNNTVFESKENVSLGNKNNNSFGLTFDQEKNSTQVVNKNDQKENVTTIMDLKFKSIDEKTTLPSSEINSFIPQPFTIKTNVAFIKSIQPILNYEKQIKSLEIVSTIPNKENLNSPFKHSVALGVGHNITSFNNQSLWTNYTIQRELFHKTSFVVSAGFSYNRIKENSLYLRIQDKNSSTNISFVESFDVYTSIPIGESFDLYNKNKTSSVIFGELGLGLNRALTSNFDFSVGCLFSYLVSANVIVDSSKSSQTIDAKGIENTLNNSFNKFYPNPYIQLMYNFNKRLSISASYTHDLRGFSNTELSNSTKPYFRQIRLGGSYRFK